MESTHFESVLLLEDDASHALLIKRALKQFASEIVHAASVSEAAELLQSRSFSLIVSDLHLPDSEGTSHIQGLGSLAKGAPIVVLTSSTSVREAVEAMKIGASDFIIKNFDGDFAQIFGLSLARVHLAVRLTRERAKLQREMAALRMAIENSTDGLAVIDGEGHVEYSNTAFQEIIARCGGTLTAIEELFSAPVLKVDKLRADLKKKREELPVGAVWQTEVALTKDVAYSLTLSVIGSSEHHNQTVLWLRDISGEKRREKFQREILSTTTHDLKGPLGAIMISAELVGDLVKENKKASDLILRIASSAHGAVNLIDEFLSARRIQEGTFILKPTNQELRSLCEEVLAGFQPVADSRSISLKLEAEKSQECKVDKLGFSRVLSNLLSNALKFTQKGGQVTVRIFAHGEDTHVQVSDNGGGMEPSEVSKLFERFSRLDKHREVAGSGLGLFVVKSIVTAHGGKIDVTSKAGQGTTFDISFPKNPPVNDRGELISLDFA
jgi:two-component system, OmpR family, phosphate regulon sensor histidine kinase PhoR